MKYFSIVFYFWSFFLGAQPYSSEVNGRVIDENGIGLPFATLLLKGSSIGTTTNINGDYSFKIPPGSHQLMVQYVGYKRQEIQLTAQNNQTYVHSFQLTPEILQLRAVTVSAKDKDPAYRVIRQAIKKRKYHRDLVQAFSCDVYIKGLQRLDKRPDKILGMTIRIDTGIVYLSESISKFNFERPNKIKEVMISSKVSGSNNAFSWNQASDMLLNFYENGFSQEGFSERPIVSPIAGNALFYYNYKLQGFFEEQGRFVNKIQVIPKRNSDPVFSGYIYIIEDEWSIHSVDLTLTKDRGIEFLDSVQVRQIYAPSDFDIWMPVSQDFNFQFKAFGFKGSGHFVGVYSHYELEPNYSVYQEKKSDTVSAKVDLFSKEDFSSEVMNIKKEANEKDSLYWIQVRPIPLSPLEVTDYVIKDSIRIVKDSKVYKDSIDRSSNKPKFGNILSGYTFQNSYKGNFYTIPSLLSAFNFNTVEGWVLDLSLEYRKEVEGRTTWRVKPTFRIGLTEERPRAKIEAAYFARDKKFTQYEFGAGRYVQQFNNDNPISAWNNTLYTLIRGSNYLKIYEKDFIKGSYQSEIVNGFMFRTNVEFQRRRPLENTNNYSFEGSRESSFTPNAPINNELPSTRFDPHNALIWSASARFRIKQTYINRPDRKIITGTKYPDFTIYFRAGIPISEEDVDFQEVSFGISDQFGLGLFGGTTYSAKVGTFLGKKNLQFPDYHHFNGNRTLFSEFGNEHFQILDYYRLSTQDQFFEGHFEHHFNEFILNNLPLIKKLNWQTVGSLHTLITPDSGHYLELGAGIEHIFKIVRVDFYQGFLDGKAETKGLRIGFGF